MAGAEGGEKSGFLSCVRYRVGRYWITWWLLNMMCLWVLVARNSLSGPFTTSFVLSIESIFSFYLTSGSAMGMYGASRIHRIGSCRLKIGQGYVREIMCRMFVCICAMHQHMPLALNLLFNVGSCC